MLNILATAKYLEDVIFQAQGACIRIRIVVILSAMALLSNISREKQMNS